MQNFTNFSTMQYYIHAEHLYLHNAIPINVPTIAYASNLSSLFHFIILMPKFCVHGIQRNANILAREENKLPFSHKSWSNFQVSMGRYLQHSSSGPLGLYGSTPFGASYKFIDKPSFNIFLI